MIYLFVRGVCKCYVCGDYMPPSKLMSLQNEILLSFLLQTFINFLRTAKSHVNLVIVRPKVVNITASKLFQSFPVTCDLSYPVSRM